MIISTNLGIWVGAIITIAVFTYFLGTKLNLFFKFAESTVVGGAIGYTLVLAVAKNFESLAYNKIMRGDLILIIPVILGLLIYARFSKNYGYLARIPVAFIVGSGLAVASYGIISTNIMSNNLTAVTNYIFINKDPFTAFTNILNMVALITAIYYFYFTGGKRQETQPFTWINKLGRYSIMIYMGANFGNVILSRNSLIIGRLQFLLYQWLGLSLSG
jgi:hypothetical protein